MPAVAGAEKAEWSNEDHEILLAMVKDQLASAGDNYNFKTVFYEEVANKLNTLPGHKGALKCKSGVGSKWTGVSSKGTQDLAIQQLRP
jgi:hypothetical protein